MTTTFDTRLTNALLQFTGCVGTSLVGVCSYGWTIGQSYVPFDPDPSDTACSDYDENCSQAWVRVMGIHPTSVEGFGGDCATELRIDLEVGVLRCVDIPEDGDAPTVSDVLVAAEQSMTDMKALYCAAMGCGAFENVVANHWEPRGPQGGQYGGIWTFTVEL